MNSARDRAETIIDELQAFLNTQQSRDDSSPATPRPPSDLDLSHSYYSSGSNRTTEVHTPLVNGHGWEQTAEEGEPWDSFYLPPSIPLPFSAAVSSAASVADEVQLAKQSKLAGSSEVLIAPGSELNLQGFSTTLNITQDGVGQQGGESNSLVLREQQSVVGSVPHKQNSVESDRGVHSAKLVHNGAVRKTQIDQSGVHKTQIDQGGVHKTKIDRSGVHKTQIDQSGVHKTQIDQSGVHKTQIDQSGVHKTHTVNGGVQKKDLVQSGGLHKQQTVVDVKNKDTKSKSVINVGDRNGKASTSSEEHSSSVSSVSSLEEVRKDIFAALKSSHQLRTVKQKQTLLQSSTTMQAQSVTTVNHTAAETGEVEVDRPESVSYDFLEPSNIPPPPPLEIKDSPSMPFPMIFRRSKKDPGSKEYNALVKELEGVLEKRNQIRRSNSLDADDVPEGVGTLRSKKKLSSSTENLSVFSNKALLSRLENHFKQRVSPPTIRKPAEKESDAKRISGHFSETVTHVESSTVTHFGPPSLVNGHANVSVISGNSVNTLHNSQGHWQGQGHTGDQHTRGFGSPMTHSAEGPVSVIRVSADSSDSFSNTTHNANSYHGNAGPVHHGNASPGHNHGLLSPPVHSPNDSFSRDMSFGSDDEFSHMSSSTLPHPQHQHFKKHHHAPARPGHAHHLQHQHGNHSHQQQHLLHQSSTNPEVMYKSQTLDRNFKHITRIAVSKSMESLPEAYARDEEEQHVMHVERQNSQPMKTIVEHFHETEPEEVAAWNQAIRSSKRHQEKGGVYRSISQRMVQKIYRYAKTRPGEGSEDASHPAAVSVNRAGSFNHHAGAHATHHHHHPHSPPAPPPPPPEGGYYMKTVTLGRRGNDVRSGNDVTDFRTLPSSRQSSGKERRSSLQSHDVVKERRTSSHSNDGDFVVELPNQARLHSVMSPPPPSSSSSLTTRTNSDSIHAGGGLTVQLPNNHTASIVPISLQPINISGGTVSIGGGGGGGHSDSPSSKPTTSVSRTLSSAGGQPGLQQRIVHNSSATTAGVSHSSTNSGGLTVQLPNNHKASIVVPSMPVNVSTNRNGTPQVSVSPQRRTTTVTRSPSHRQTYRPAEKGSPFTQEIGEGVLPPAHGDGLYRGEEDKAAVFYIDARGMTGEPSVQVDGPNSIAKCSIDPQPDGQYAVTYIPVEVGMFDVMIKWNGKELPGSPYHPKVVCARKVQVVGGWQHYMDSKERVHLVVNEEKQIPFDNSEAGPGKMTAEVKGPSGLIPVTVDDSVVGRSTVIFTPREEGNHYIHLYWSDTPLNNSPFTGYATGGHLDPSKVILTGRGLKEAIVREEAEFMIDASQAGQGTPEVQLTGVRAEVNVFTTPLGGGKFRCTYIPVVPGAYLLHITWNGRQLRGSPYKVNVIGAFYPNRVGVSGEGLKGGLLGRDLEIRIDTRKAGPGELTAYCMGPTKVANCVLEDHHDGTFRLIVRPQEVGRHVLQVKYGGEHVLGSPFAFKVSAQPDASKVRVSGPGVEHGLLATFQSRFVVETRGAGAGQLTVRIRGPKGAFQVEMYRDSQKDRTILCRYDPVETGLYIISIRWSGNEVPGSPFNIHILDTQAELEQVLTDQSFHHNASFHSSRAGSGYGQWREEF